MTINWEQHFSRSGNILNDSVIGSEPTTSTIRLGSTGDSVVTWQKFLKLKADGIFGNGTDAATKAYQLAHHLTADGVVGPATWQVAFPRTKAPLPKSLDLNNIHVKAKIATDAVPGITHNESMFTRGVGWHETDYGLGWGSTPPPNGGAGSFNMGAITTTNPGPLDFQHVDSRNDTGEVIQYTTWFKGYPSFTAGMQGLAQFLLKPNVKAALAKGDFPGAVQAMYDNHYFLGIHPRNTAAGNAANVTDYVNAVNNAVATFTQHTGEQIKKSSVWRNLLFAGLGITAVGVGVKLYGKLD